MFTRTFRRRGKTAVVGSKPLFIFHVKSLMWRWFFFLSSGHEQIEDEQWWRGRVEWRRGGRGGDEDQGLQVQGQISGQWESGTEEASVRGDRVRAGDGARLQEQNNVVMSAVNQNCEQRLSGGGGGGFHNCQHWPLTLGSPPPPSSSKRLCDREGRGLKSVFITELTGFFWFNDRKITLTTTRGQWKQFSELLLVMSFPVWFNGVKMAARCLSVNAIGIAPFRPTSDRKNTIKSWTFHLGDDVTVTAQYCTCATTVAQRGRIKASRQKSRCLNREQSFTLLVLVAV